MTFLFYEVTLDFFFWRHKKVTLHKIIPKSRENCEPNHFLHHAYSMKKRNHANAKRESMTLWKLHLTCSNGTIFRRAFKKYHTATLLKQIVTIMKIVFLAIIKIFNNCQQQLKIFMQFPALTIKRYSQKQKVGTRKNSKRNINKSRFFSTKKAGS